MYQRCCTCVITDCEQNAAHYTVTDHNYVIYYYYYYIIIIIIISTFRNEGGSLHKQNVSMIFPISTPTVNQQEYKCGLFIKRELCCMLQKDHRHMINKISVGRKVTNCVKEYLHLSDGNLIHCMIIVCSLQDITHNQKVQSFQPITHPAG